jgi:hypothetical protein
MREKIGTMQGLIAASAGTGISGSDIFGLFNVFVGLMVVAAILVFIAGLIVWVVRLGTIGRSQGIRIMEWGVVILFVLDVLLALVQYFSTHSQAVTLLTSALITIFIGWIIFMVIKNSGGSEGEEAH